MNGYRVEAGSLVAVGIYALHHDPTLWPNPMDFDPDRFSPENVKARDRWQFLPFLGGGRPCIGEHFARLETTLALATIVRAMKVRSIDQDFACEVPFTTVAKGPIRAPSLDAGEQHRLLERQTREDRPPQPVHRRAAWALGITCGSRSSNVLP